MPAEHPKRVFINHLIELEIRLSYFERIKKSLPDPFQELDVLVTDPTDYKTSFGEG